MKSLLILQPGRSTSKSASTLGEASGAAVPTIAEKARLTAASMIFWATSWASGVPDISPVLLSRPHGLIADADGAALGEAADIVNLPEGLPAGVALDEVARGDSHSGHEHVCRGRGASSVGAPDEPRCSLDGDSLPQVHVESLRVRVVRVLLAAEDGVREKGLGEPIAAGCVRGGSLGGGLALRAVRCSWPWWW
jgi:hypothetical protein